MNFMVSELKVKNVLLIQHNWPLQSFTKNLALSLIKKHNVILCIDSGSLDFDRDGYKALINAGVQIVRLDPCKGKCLKYIISYLYRILVRFTPLVMGIKHRFAGKIINKNFDVAEYIIAIEKEALIIAGHVLPKTPTFYYSLELYFDEEKASRRYKYIRKKEKTSLCQISAIIIQDDFRAKSFLNNNGVKNLPIVTLPVSVPARDDRLGHEKPDYWHNKFSIPGNIKIILYFGLIKKGNRGLEEFVKNFPVGGDFALILHGYGSLDFIKTLRKLGVGKRIFISSEFVSVGEIDLLIRSSDIGLCWYSNHDDNNRHTAFSSEKIALFLRNGVPIFSNFSETYGELYSRFECGVGDVNPINLHGSSVKIISEYNKYSDNSYEAFQFFYDHDKNYLLAEKAMQNVLLSIAKCK